MFAVMIPMMLEAVKMRGPASPKCTCTPRALINGCKHKRDDHDQDCYIDIRSHISSIYRSISELECQHIFMRTGPHQWEQVKYNLFMAQAIQSVRSDTSFFIQDRSNHCGGWSLLDGMMDDVADALMKSSLRFNFVWTAFESMIKKQTSPTRILSSLSNQKGGGARKMAETMLSRELMLRLDASFAMPAALRSARDAALVACAVVGDMDVDIEALRSNPEKWGGDDTIAFCAALVRAFRNHVAHGQEMLAWPDNDAFHTGTRGRPDQARIDRHDIMSRIILLIFQMTLMLEISQGVTVRAGDDGDGEWVMVDLVTFLEGLHLHSAGTGGRLRICNGPIAEELPAEVMSRRERSRLARVAARSRQTATT